MRDWEVKRAAYEIVKARHKARQALKACGICGEPSTFNCVCGTIAYCSQSCRTVELIFDNASKKPPAQRQLASIGYHEDWLVCVAANQAADAAALADGIAARRHRALTKCENAFLKLFWAIMRVIKERF